MQDIQDDSDENFEDYPLIEPKDFSEFCALIDSREATSEHYKEYDLRMINHFCTCIYAGKQPENWVLYALAKAFTKVTMGGKWEDEFQLPWTEASSPWTVAENKDLKIFCEIANRLKGNPTIGVLDTISAVADENCSSFEKARAAYYKHKHLIK